MSYTDCICFRGVRDLYVENTLREMCEPRIYDDVELFIFAVSACSKNTLIVILGEAGPDLNRIVKSARNAASWNLAGVRHFWTVAARGCSPAELVQAFREGCDGYIRLPATPQQILRGLPKSMRERCSISPQSMGPAGAGASSFDGITQG